MLTVRPDHPLRCLDGCEDITKVYNPTPVVAGLNSFSLIPTDDDDSNPDKIDHK